MKIEAGEKLQEKMSHRRSRRRFKRFKFCGFQTFKIFVKNPSSKQSLKLAPKFQDR